MSPNLEPKGNATARPFRMPQRISSEKLSGLAGVSRRRIGQLSQEGRIPAPKRGAYPARRTIVALLRYYRELSESRAPIATGRLELLRTQNQKLDLEIRRMRSKSIELPAVREAVRKISVGIERLVRDTLQREYPSRAGVDAETAARLAVLGKETADEVVELMGEGFRQWIEAPDPQPEAPAGVAE